MSQTAAKGTANESVQLVDTPSGKKFDLPLIPGSVGPKVIDVRKLYGDTAQAKQMLIARRLVERGVRYVQVWHGTLQPWDSHNNIAADHRKLARESCQGITALLSDLKSRGLLDDTLVIWGGEFGRTPMNEVRRGINPGKEGRDHHPFAFTMLLAGGGVRGGQIIGERLGSVAQREHWMDPTT